MNWRKEKEIERKATKALQNKTKVDDPKGDINTFATKENMKPLSKRKRAAKKIYISAYRFSGCDGNMRASIAQHYRF